MIGPSIFRKFHFVLFLIFICTISTNAQRFTGGVLLGLNGSQIDGDTYSGYHKAGLMCGIYTYTSVSSRNSFQIEIKYMGKGASKPPTENDLTLYKSNLHYIDIPIIFQRKLKEKIILELGLGFGYLLKYSEEDGGGEVPIEHTAQFKPLEISYIVGLGYKLTDRLTAKLRFVYSAQPVVDVPEIEMPVYFDRNAYNNVLSVGLFYDLQ